MDFGHSLTARFVNETHGVHDDAVSINRSIIFRLIDCCNIDAAPALDTNIGRRSLRVFLLGGPKTAHGFHCNNTFSTVKSQPIFIIFATYTL